MIEPKLASIRMQRSGSEHDPRCMRGDHLSPSAAVADQPRLVGYRSLQGNPRADRAMSPAL